MPLPGDFDVCIVKMVFADMRSDNYLTAASAKKFTVMDPTCGVGTLLIDSSREFSALINTLDISEEVKISCIKRFRSSGIIGQDKVDRMVRLSKINTMLAGGNISNVFSGNSIIGDSAIDDYAGKVDFIFTNPPFGADYSIEDISFDKFPMLNQMEISSNTITSELLMLIKSISLLKDGGYLAIVLPDSVFSSKGINAQIRKIILHNYQVRAIVELPAVAFAQAGTRTKTSVLYLKKSSPKRQAKIAMGICEGIKPKYKAY